MALTLIPKGILKPFLKSGNIPETPSQVAALNERQPFFGYKNHGMFVINLASKILD